jgi:hypothetical protein
MFIKDPIELYARIRGALSYKKIQEWKHKLGVAVIPPYLGQIKSRTV